MLNTGFSCPRTVNQQGFTLIEFIAVIVVLGVLSVAVVERWFRLDNDAELAQAKAVAAALRSGYEQVQLSALVQGLVKTGRVDADVAGVEVRFRGGFPVNTNSSAHIPAGISQRGRAGTRLFYLFLSAPYPSQYDLNDQPTGWEYRTSNCRSAVLDWSPARPSGGRYRCWEYKRDNSPVYLVTYSGNNGAFFTAIY